MKEYLKKIKEKLNKKKDNKKKGFTLIELLAVIVILAIVLVVTIPSVLNSMNEAKKKQLNNLTVSVAKWFDEALASDTLGLDVSIFGNASKNIEKNKWYFLNDVNGVNVAEIYGLNSDDVVFDCTKGENISLGNDFSFDPSGKLSVPSKLDAGDLCSSIRIVDGKAEVFLVASKNGKFDLKGAITYSYSLSNTSFDSTNRYNDRPTPEKEPEELPIEEPPIVD